MSVEDTFLHEKIDELKKDLKGDVAGMKTSFETLRTEVSLVNTSVATLSESIKATHSRLMEHINDHKAITIGLVIALATGIFGLLVK